MDAAALHTFDSFDEAMVLQEFRQKYPADTKWTFRTFDVDGQLLERWFLKTLINISFGGRWVIGAGEHEPGKPSLELIQIAFGHRSFGENEGLHVSTYVGYKAELRQGLSFTSLTNGRNHVAARFKFVGLQFLLSLYPDSPMGFDGTSQLIRHLRMIYFERIPGRSKRSHRIRFTW